MENMVDIVGGGLAGSEAALQLARRGMRVRLFEMRPAFTTPVHAGGSLAELVCSNSLKSTKPDSAAGMLKAELDVLGSVLYGFACEYRVAAGGALAVDRVAFAGAVTAAVEASPNIRRIGAEVVGIGSDGRLSVRMSPDEEPRPCAGPEPCAIILASGPLTSAALAGFIEGLTGSAGLAFYDAAAPIVMADSLDHSKVFEQNRYEDAAGGDYLNAAFDKESYEVFMTELLDAELVVKRSFETSDLFQACQPIEEIARRGIDAPRFGPLKPVGIVDPVTGRRPWAVVQLRAEDAHRQSYNLVGFQTNLTWPEQRRVFRMIPGLENAEFARYGVMHRNTFIDAPHLVDASLRLVASGAEKIPVPVFVAGQLGGTEGYVEAIRSGLHAALSVAALCKGVELPRLPQETAFGALLAYAADPATQDYQPMHVNFGIMKPLPEKIRNKRQRYAAYAQRGRRAMEGYVEALRLAGLLGGCHERPVER